MHAQRIDHLSHDHVFLGESHDAHAIRTRWVVALTTAVMVIEVIAGVMTGSMSWLADSIHLAAHAGALRVAAFA